MAEITGKETSYKTATAGQIVIGVIFVISLFIVLTDPSPIDIWIPWAYLFILFVALVDIKFGMYAGIKQGQLYEIKHFVINQNVDINKIE